MQEQSQPATAAQQTISQIGRKQREQLNSTLSTYKQQKMKKKMGADTQMIQFAERELEIKEKMMERLESMSQDHRDTMNLLTTNLKMLSDTVTNAFSMLQQSLQQRLGPSHLQPFPAASPSYGHHYAQYASPHHPYVQSPVHSMSATPSTPVFQPISEQVTPTRDNDQVPVLSPLHFEDDD